MGTLGFGIGGAIIGSFFGMPNLGFLAGSLLGGFLFPPDPTIQEGPRLQDLNMAGSSYGVPIRISYGTIKEAGNGIWAGTVEEVENQQAVGGKGSAPTAVQVTYTYFASFAVAFSEGVAQDVLRIWFDNKLVYDKRAPLSAPFTGSLAGVLIQALDLDLKFTFHSGSETQIPDPIIEAEEGVGNVSAHRGLCYIVFDHVNLTDHGNRFPVVTAEIAFKSQGSNTDRFSDDDGLGIFTSFNLNDMAVDHKRRRIYTVGSGTGVSGLRVYDMDTLVEIRQENDTNITSPHVAIDSAGELHVGADSGFIYFDAGTANTRPIIKVNPDSLTEVARFGFESTLGGPPDTFNAINLACEVLAYEPALVPGQITRKHYLVVRTTFGDLGILQADNMTYLYFNGSFPVTIRGIAAGKAAIGVATAWVCVQNGTDNTQIDIYKISIRTDSGILTDGSTFGVEPVLVDSILPASWNNDGSGSAIGPMYDQSDDGLHLALQAILSSGVKLTVLSGLRMLRLNRHREPKV